MNVVKVVTRNINHGVCELQRASNGETRAVVRMGTGSIVRIPLRQLRKSLLGIRVVLACHEQ